MEEPSYHGEITTVTSDRRETLSVDIMLRAHRDVLRNVVSVSVWNEPDDYDPSAVIDLCAADARKLADHLRGAADALATGVPASTVAVDRPADSVTSSDGALVPADVPPGDPLPVIQEATKGCVRVRLLLRWPAALEQRYGIEVSACNGFVGQSKVINFIGRLSLEEAESLFEGITKEVRDYDWERKTFVLEEAAA